MRQSIESMKTNLDKLVDQRTKELEIKNQELFEREKDLEKLIRELSKHRTSQRRVHINGQS